MTAAFAHLCLACKALHKVIKTVDIQRGLAFPLPPLQLPKGLFPPRAARKSYHLASTQKPSIFMQYKEKQIFFPLGKADQEESSGLRWLR